MGTRMDWFDLNEWVLENMPELHNATKCISSMELQIECWQKAYDNYITSN